MSNRPKIKTAYFTENGKALLEKLRAALPEMEFAHRGEESLGEFAEAAFNEGCPLLFIGASGIAIRTISSFVKDKLTDPPVLVMDEPPLL